MDEKPQPDALLTIKQVAHLLNVSEKTVRRLVEEGKFARPRKIGGSPKAAARWFGYDVEVYRWRLMRGDFVDEK